MTKEVEDKVEVVRVEGLLADYVIDHNIDFQIRGIRSHADLDSELTMGIVNRRLSKKETIFLLASSSRVHISSSLIRELAMYQTRLDNFVPPEIEDEVYSYLFEYYKKANMLNGKPKEDK